jgi:centromere protein C
MDARELPLSKYRKKSEGTVVGFAAQAFNMTNTENPAFPGYIVGTLDLPPKGIKDAESVGLCAQVFTVVQAQPDALELAFGDPDESGVDWNPKTAERFLLSVGDTFLVPPGNAYRLQNHSKTTDCLMSWTIVRHNEHLTAPDSP